MKVGPSVRRLIAERMAQNITILGGLDGALKTLASRSRLAASAREAELWVDKAIRAVKSAPDNPYGDDDEAIASKILESLNERRSRAPRA